MSDYIFNAMPEQIDTELIARLRSVETSTVGHWRPWGFCDGGIRPFASSGRVAGTAVTLALPDRDNRALHRAMSLVRPGDILMIDRLNDRRFACLGGVVAAAAAARGLNAAVIDGPCTDPDELRALGFPLWCRGVVAQTSRLDKIGGRMNVPISVGGVVVMPGDAVVCDEAGVLVLPSAEAAGEAERALRHQDFAANAMVRLQRGEPLANISGADAIFESA